jgi:isopentenyldiphosphate isomerase
MKGHERVDGEANVNFVCGHPIYEYTLDRNVERLCDLETLGIREENDCA